MFYISSVIFLIGAVVYVIFGSAERQSWATENEIDNVGDLVDPATETVQDHSSKTEIIKNEV